MRPETRESGIEQISPEQKEQMIMELGGKFHSEWQKAYKKDPKNKPTRVKVKYTLGEGEEKKDAWFNESDIEENIKKGVIPPDATETSRQDILNTDFEDLEPKWQ